MQKELEVAAQRAQRFLDGCPHSPAMYPEWSPERLLHDLLTHVRATAESKNALVADLRDLLDEHADPRS